jgi:glycosyltransferase involved in cell wall biosynthesis
MLPYLKLCCASVQDQGVDLEHIVMDGGSSDGTSKWLLENIHVISESKKDNGMYNALNKAIRLAKGEIVAHLNSDEQYLPHTLPFVLEYFKKNPDVDFIAGDFLVVDEEGELVAFRKNFSPRWPYFFSNYLYTTTCTLFYRRKVFESCQFDESFKSIADVVFLYNVIKCNFKGAYIRKYFSTFTFSGSNLSLSPISAIEKRRFGKLLPLWFRFIKPLFRISFYAEKLFHGSYWENSLAYSIYSKESIEKRVLKIYDTPTFRLKFRTKVMSN